MPSNPRLRLRAAPANKFYEGRDGSIVTVESVLPHQRRVLKALPDGSGPIEAFLHLRPNEAVPATLTAAVDRARIANERAALEPVVAQTEAPLEMPGQPATFDTLVAKSSSSSIPAHFTGDHNGCQ